MMFELNSETDNKNIAQNVNVKYISIKCNNDTIETHKMIRTHLLNLDKRKNSKKIAFVVQSTILH